MLKPRWEAFARWNGVYHGHEFHIIRNTGDDRDYVSAVDMKPVSRSMSISDQVIPFDEVEEFLQACMDAAWEIGLRPKGFADVGSQLKATQDHLEDMRHIAKMPNTSTGQRTRS